MNLKVQGLADMTRKLTNKIRRLEQRVMREALQEFAEPIRRNAEQLARSLISSRIKVVTQIRLRGTGGTVKIGPSTETFEVKPNGQTITSANVAYWFEFGYDIRAKKKGPSLKHVGARPSLTPAYHANKDAALAAFENKMRAALEAEV